MGISAFPNGGRLVGRQPIAVLLPIAGLQRPACSAPPQDVASRRRVTLLPISGLQRPACSAPPRDVVSRRRVTLSLCHSVTLSLCHSVTLSLCHSVWSRGMWPVAGASLCHSVTLSLCHSSLSRATWQSICAHYEFSSAGGQRTRHGGPLFRRTRTRCDARRNAVCNRPSLPAPPGGGEFIMASEDRGAAADRLHSYVPRLFTCYV